MKYDGRGWALDCGDKPTEAPMGSKHGNPAHAHSRERPLRGPGAKEGCRAWRQAVVVAVRTGTRRMLPDRRAILE